MDRDCILVQGRHEGINSFLSSLVTTNFKPNARNLRPDARNFKPDARNFKPVTTNFKPVTRNFKPDARTPRRLKRDINFREATLN